MTHHTPERVRTKRAPRTIVATVLLSILALILAACGARLETNLTVEEGGKGTRIMYTDFNLKEDANYIKGGADALDASIRKHLPSQLTFDGITRDGDKARATFKLSFESTSDYQAKVTALLKTSGSTTTPNITLSETKEGLVTGIRVNENFTTKELLGWIPESLVVDGVIESNRKSNVLGTEEKTVLTYQGKEIKSSSYTRLQVSEVQDNGFSNMVFKLQITDASKAEAKIYLVAKDIMSPERSQTVDNYLNAHLPTNASVARGIDEQAVKSAGLYYTNAPTSDEGKAQIGRTISFSGSMEEIQAGLKKLLGDNNSLQYSSQLKNDSGSLYVYDQVKGTINCASVCSPGAKIYSDIDSSQGSSNYERSYNKDYTNTKDGDGKLELSAYHRTKVVMKSAKVETTVKDNQSVEAKFSFGFDAEQAKIADASLRNSFKLPEGQEGEVSTREENDQIYYEATLTGKDPKEFESRLRAYLPDSSFSMSERAFYAPFGEDYRLNAKYMVGAKIDSSFNGSYDFKLTMPDELSKAGSDLPYKDAAVSGKEITYHQDSMSGSSSANSKEFTLQAHGITLMSMIIDGVLVLLILAGCVLIIRAIRRSAKKRAEAVVNPVVAVPAANAPVANAPAQAAQPAPTATMPAPAAPAQPTAPAQTIPAPTVPMPNIPAPNIPAPNTQVPPANIPPANIPAPNSQPTPPPPAPGQSNGYGSYGQS